MIPLLRSTAAVAAAVLALVIVHPASSQTTVVGGPGNDYQATVIRPWDDPDARIAVFERLDASYFGDLWLTRSADGGATWSAPVLVVGGPEVQRHASLVQTGSSHFQLFYLSDTGGYRIHRAESTDGFSFQPQGPLDLGWPTAGEVNPQVVRTPDGDLVLSYHRNGGAAHVAHSTDGGLTWDTLRTQVSPTLAALPRMVRREADGRWLLAYQTGVSPVAIWTRTSDDPLDWSGPETRLVTDGNNHDPWPVVLGGGEFAVLFTRVAGGAFQIHSSHSRNGESWTPPLAHSDRPGLKNVQPMALPEERGRVELYWAAGQVPGDADYDIVRVASALVADTIFAHDFDSAD